MSTEINYRHSATFYPVRYRLFGDFLSCRLRLDLQLGAVLLMVGRSYVGNDVTHSTLLDGACACSYKNLPKYRSYRVSNTAPWSLYIKYISWSVQLQTFGDFLSCRLRLDLQLVTISWSVQLQTFGDFLLDGFEKRVKFFLLFLLVLLLRIFTV